MADLPITIKYDDASHAYAMNVEGGGYQPCPGVTTILGETEPKDALGWWGMRVGFAAVVRMMQDVSWAEIANCGEPAHIVSPHLLPEGDRYYSKGDRKKLKPKSFIEAWTVDHKASVNHLKEDAADRGTAIHKVLEDLALDVMPSVEDFPAEQRGWVAGVIQWWLDQEPTIVESELIVGSREHWFAGRFDLVIEDQQGRRGLIDLKTSKSVYKSHVKQLAMYELAYVEMGGEPFDFKQVLQVSDQGVYQLVDSLYTPELVIPTLAMYHADQRAEALHARLPVSPFPSRRKW